MDRKKYVQLSYEDRCQIDILLRGGKSLSSIARHLNVNRSTISRELKRNGAKGDYRYTYAHKKYIKRRDAANSKPRKFDSSLKKEVDNQLIKEQWSPEQISGWLKRKGLPSVSPEWIYQYVWKNKKAGGKLYLHLRHRGKKYNKRGAKQAGRGLIPDRIDIEERPAVVAEKNRLGDWELDTVIGTGNSGVIVSMVDRCSKFTKLKLVATKHTEIVCSAIKEALGDIREFVLTMTADNGKEFAKHKSLSKYLGAQVYFAKPYHSWERGLNEHTNGLLRQYFPKSKRFDTISAEDVQQVENLLNSRPRKVLSFRTPLEIFNQAKFKHANVAIRT